MVGLEKGGTQVSAKAPRKNVFEGKISDGFAFFTSDAKPQAWYVIRGILGGIVHGRVDSSIWQGVECLSSLQPAPLNLA